MHRFLLAAAPLSALALAPAPAGAEFPNGFTAQPGQFEQFAALPNVHRGVILKGKHHDGRRHRRSTGVVIGVPWGVSEGWALYNNRSWESGSYNDWWHDRPDRAYPRWMQNNQNCDRVWWGGGVWRC